MSRRSWVLVGAAVVIVAAVLGVVSARRDPSKAAPSGSAVVVAASATIGTTAGPSQSPAPEPTPPTTPSPTPAAPAVTSPPRASGPPRLAYAEFLRRLDDDRTTVERLNATLTTAVQALDPATVKPAAVDILDFVDGERDWLRENPPAGCYAKAHASAGAMLDAYGAAADGFIVWAETGGGFAGLGALGKALDQAQTAGDALTAFTKVLGATTCPA